MEAIIMALRSRKAKESDNLESEVTKEPIKATESGMETPEKEPAKAELPKKKKYRQIGRAHV